MTALRGATSLGLGIDHTCAGDSDGAVQCLGKNSRATRSARRIVLAIRLRSRRRNVQPHARFVADLSCVVQLAAGNRHTCALDIAGDVFCWGGDDDGQLGDGLDVTRATPRRVLSHAVTLAAGTDHTCAILEGGALMCWVGTASARSDPRARNRAAFARSTGG